MEYTATHDRLVPTTGWESLCHEAQGSSSSGTGKVLVVHPSATRRREVRSLLVDLVHEVIETSNTSDAISSISTSRVDLVLLGPGIPEREAGEFCRMLKKASATQFLPVFVMSDSPDPESEARAIEAGADDFLVTPPRPAVFRARVIAGLKQKAMIDSLDDPETVLFSLAQSVEERDPGLGQHCQRLAIIASTIGAAWGCAPREILALQRGGYLHDVGKVAIPDHILFKAGPLDSSEWEIMKSHAERGERICCNMRSLAPVLPIIRHHHERWNGTGYPDRLKGEEIPLLARILQLADIYDALTTVRPYKRALRPEEALGVLRDEAGKGWRDPRLVDAFADLLPKFRTCAPAEMQFSLHALAASVDRFRKEPSRTASLGSNLVQPEAAKLVGNL